MEQRRRPTVFIGSSKEGLRYANAVFSELEGEAEPLVWDQSIFAPTRGTLEELERLAHAFDFAVLVLTPDDERHSRGQAAHVPRDNLIAELGLFIGALGRERVVFLTPRDEPMALPTDFLGVTALHYSSRQDENYRAAVRTACTEIAKVIRQKGIQTGEQGPLQKVDLLVWASEHESHAQTEVCLYIPREATRLTVSRRPFVPAAGDYRPVWMTIRPAISTAYPHFERANVTGTLTLAVSGLTGETCFSFENEFFQREAQGIAQAYKYFAQILTIEIH